MPRRPAFRALAIGRLPILAACLALAPAAARAGAPTVIQNDSVTDFDEVAIQVGFVEDERAAAWLTATCDGDLTAVQVLWLSLLGGQPDTLGQAIEIWQPGSFPVPGTRIRELLGPLMVDGFFNQFPVVPPVAMTTGQTLVVGFQFLSDPPALGPSVVTDTDGCQAGRNGIFAIPPSGWFNACALGVSGDFAIRGVVDCGVSIIFEDGFESGDTSAWSAVVP
jgi:hypothetical protein